MTEENLIDKIEWVNKRSSLRDEPLTRNQKELLMFVFADNVNKIDSSNPLIGSFYSPNETDKWKVIAIDLYNKVYLESPSKDVYFYNLETFYKNFKEIDKL